MAKLCVLLPLALLFASACARSIDFDSSNSEEAVIDAANSLVGDRFHSRARRTTYGGGYQQSYGQSGSVDPQFSQGYGGQGGGFGQGQGGQGHGGFGGGQGGQVDPQFSQGHGGFGQGQGGFGQGQGGQVDSQFGQGQGGYGQGQSGQGYGGHRGHHGGRGGQHQGGYQTYGY